MKSFHNFFNFLYNYKKQNKLTFIFEFSIILFEQALLDKKQVIYAKKISKNLYLGSFFIIITFNL